MYSLLSLLLVLGIDLPKGILPKTEIFLETMASLELRDVGETHGVVDEKGNYSTLDEDSAKTLPSLRRCDILFFRERWKEFGRCPPVADAHRFPPADYLQNQITFAEEFLRQMKFRRDLSGENVGCPYENTIDECAVLLRIYRQAKDVRTPGYCISHRKKCLGDLLRTLGPVAYDRGILPPSVPLWRFKSVE